MRIALLLAALLTLGTQRPAPALEAPTVPTTVGITGGSSAATQTLPPGQSAFGLRVPLRANAENELVVAASNSKSPTAVEGGIKIMQIALQDVVLARVEARRLTVAEVKTLVADGTIQLSDPANFNVSLFVVVLTIADQPVTIRMPVVQTKNDPEPPVGKPISIGCGAPGQPLTATETAIRVPCGDGGGGNPPDGPPQIILPFVIDVPDAPFVPPIPGVIVLEGRIKTLKEFFNVSLILSNVSSIFTLSGVQATLEVPEGKMTLVKPASGPVMIDDLPPGAEKRGDFVTRGDKIGTHTVTAHFSADISGLGIATPIPVSGQASTDIEVKGPPKMDVRVEHPSAVRGGEPYELIVEITNTDDEIPALYTSFALDVGADARIIDPLTNQPRTTADVRQLGDILPGEKSVQRYTILPLKTGPITSCTAGATENLRLDIAFVGGQGPQCAIGTFPSDVADLGGEPTVIVVPTHNTVGVTVQPAVTAIFSAPMLADTITTGFAGATFRLLDPNGVSVPSSLEVTALGSGRTIALLRPHSPLSFLTKYTVEVVPDIFDVDGRRLASGYAGRFTTEASAQEIDLEAPTALLTIEPPTVPTAVPLGQLVPLRVDAFDNLGITRIDLQVNGQFVDSQPGQSTTHFMLDTASLAPNQTHAVRVVAFDGRGNQGVDQATITVFSDTTAPTASFTAATAALRGRALPVVLQAQDNGGVARAEVFVDGGATPVFTGLLTPFQFAVATADLAPGPHTLRGVVRDGAGNETETTHAFDVTDDTEPPLITFLSPAAGAQLGAGQLVAVNATVTDDVGVDTVAFFLDAEAAPRATGQQGFVLDTATIPLGAHAVRVDATDLAGNTSSATLLFDVLPIVPDTTAPALPVLVTAGIPVVGVSHVVGQNGAVESNARVEVVNQRDGTTAVVDASFDGGFATPIDAEGGDTLRVTAIDKAGNRSAPLDVVVPHPPVLLSITVAPVSVALTRAQPSRQLVVTGHFDDLTSAPITDGVTFASAHPTIASVDAAGLVLPGQNGDTTITVGAPGVASVQVPVNVAFPTIASVEVEPASVAVFTAGAQQTRQLAVTAVLSDGFRQPFPGKVLFASQNETVATVTGAGLVAGVSAGSTTVVVAPNGFSAIDVPVTVTGRALASIAIAPSSMTFVGPGQSQALTVTGTFNDASSADVTAQASCVSGTTAVATVTGTTVVSAADGDAVISCTVPGVAPATATVRVKSYQSIAVTPNPIQLIGAGKTQQLTVTATFTDASQTTLSSGLTFGTDNAAAATVTAAGLVVSTGVGSATITATFGTLQGTTDVTVIARVADGIAVTPTSLLFTSAGQTAALNVSAHFNDGTTGPTVDPVGFQSSTPAVATVSSTGTVTAVATGSATISINSGPFSTTVPVTVDIPVANPPPVISRIDRPRAAEGDQFVIDGANFAGLPAENTVVVDGVTATVLGARKDQLVAVVPSGVASGTGVRTVDVQVVANLQASNIATLGIYQRKATAVSVTPGVDQVIPGGSALPLPAIPPVEVRAGERVFLSSSGNMLAPVDVTGTLQVQIDGGAFTTVTDEELTSLFTAGTHTVALRIVESGGVAASGPIHLIAGPDGTGPIAGELSVIALGQSRLLPITFTNLTALDGSPLPDGSTVVVSAAGGCTNRDRGGNCLFGASGAIAGGGVAPEFGDVPHSRVFTVTGGRLDVLFDPAGNEIPVSSGAVAFVAVLPANASGTRTSVNSLAHRPVTLATLDSAAGPRSQSVTLGNGGQNLIDVALEDFRDSTGARVPDGAVVIVSTLGNCNHRDRFGNCLFPSAGGNILGGEATGSFGDVPHTRGFTLASGRVAFQYDPSPVQIGAGSQATADVHVLPGRPHPTTGAAGASQIGTHSFEEIFITLTSAGALQTTISTQPGSVLGDDGDRRATITVSNIVDGNGVPVPNGTKVVVSTLGNCNHRFPDGNCIFAPGGVIVGGTASADFGDVTHTRVFTVQSGQLVVVYSSQGLALESRQTTTAVVQLLPSTPSGARIGTTSFATTNVTVAGYDQAGIVATPTSVAATGLSQIVPIAVTGMLDAAGAPIPDGAKVVVSTLGGCNFRDRNGNCVNSAGGAIANGVVGPDYGNVTHTRVFTVQDGAVLVQYDPASIAVPVGTTQTATITVTGARPNGSRIGGTSFVHTTVLLTSPVSDAMHVSTVPASTLAGARNDAVTIRVTDITDGQGLPIPDGTKVSVSALGNCNVRFPDGNCIFAPNGTIEGGAVSATYGDVPHTRVFTVQDGAVQAVFRPSPTVLESPSTSTAVVAFQPATPAGERIGDRAFVVANVALTSPASAQITGAGSLPPNGSATYVVTDMRDTSNVPIPDGTRVDVSTLGNCNHRDIGGGCIFATAGTITNGAPSASYGDAGHTRSFVVTNGQVSVDLQVPASGTVVLQVLPTRFSDGTIIFARAFGTKSIAVTP